MSTQRELKEFVKQLEAAGLEVTRRKDSSYVVRKGNQLLGAFKDLEGGRTKKNILAQIKRATGIVIETPSKGGGSGRRKSKNVHHVKTVSRHGGITPE